MSGSMPPLPQYALMSWCSVKAQGQLDGGKWSASHPGHFTLGGKIPGIHWRGPWMGLRVGLDMTAGEKFQLLPGIKPQLSNL
jgi:hypothetical protein